MKAAERRKKIFGGSFDNSRGSLPHPSSPARYRELANSDEGKFIKKLREGKTVIFDLKEFVKTNGGFYPVEADHISAIVPARKTSKEQAIKIHLLGGQTLEIDGFFTVENRNEVLLSIYLLWKNYQSKKGEGEG